ncbi:hypothetical protein CEUSTIGMA_g8124.t1 [Chlamydomonas eustigma]|uniref:Uncharacterized protein n=1 Tax=Chlamydomonas eustigma TaxID=1157962 RepID=A0A250XCS2_9CHLO|nr:hypothetical protein CEUSTIGMA_g8124.t1 [Chlamydomonas eustigma]|eukprot:GAX80689.1 hypothetical protein CEUSTIGMA_g8124.t1 [Chlamydomonas eustigma]
MVSMEKITSLEPPFALPSLKQKRQKSAKFDLKMNEDSAASAILNESLRSMSVTLPDFRRRKTSELGFLMQMSTSSRRGSLSMMPHGLPHEYGGDSNGSHSEEDTEYGMAQGDDYSNSANLPDEMRSAASFTSKNKSRLLGPGGVPTTLDRESLRPREAEICEIAAVMGMHRTLPSLSSSGSASKSGHTFAAAAAGSRVAVSLNNSTVQNARAMSLGQVPLPSHPVKPTRPKTAAATVNQISTRGIRLSELLSFASRVPEGMPTSDVAKRFIMPQTAPLRCRYLDVLDEKFTNQPNAYVMHSSRMSFRLMTRALQMYFEGNRQQCGDVYVWLDIFSVNLHKDTSESDLSSIRDILTNANKVLFVLDPKGVVFSSSWVMWELWLLARSEHRDQLVVVPVSWAWRDLRHAYASMDLERCTAHSQRAQYLITKDFQSYKDPNMIPRMKDALLVGAKREMARLERFGNIHNRLFFEMVSCYALLLYLSLQYTDAEEMLRLVKHCMEKANRKDMAPEDESWLQLRWSAVARDKGNLTQAEALLQNCLSSSRSIDSDTRLGAMSHQVEVLMESKQYTRGEMMCRKMMEVIKDTSAQGLQERVRSHISITMQLADISIMQNLYEEGRLRAEEGLELAGKLDGPDSLLAAPCYLILARCGYNASHYEDIYKQAQSYAARALSIHTQQLGFEHPSTLKVHVFQAEVAISEGRLEEAEATLSDVHAVWLRLYGNGFVSTLEALGKLVDVQRRLKKYRLAENSEDDMMITGLTLLKSKKLDCLRSLSLITQYLAARDYLLLRSSQYFARAFLTFKERLGLEHELTRKTHVVLQAVVRKHTLIGKEALEDACISGDLLKLQEAEMMFKQAWSAGKLLRPDDKHELVVMGLASALSGLGRLEEAKQVLRAAGLARLKMHQAVPVSYKRWLKPRVAKYMDDKEDEEEERFAQLQAMEALQRTKSVSTSGGAQASAGNKGSSGDEEGDQDGGANGEAGGAVKGGRKALPVSYRRWYNKRVDQFLRSEKDKK